MHRNGLRQESTMLDRSHAVHDEHGMRIQQVHPLYFAVIHDRKRDINMANPRDTFAAQYPIAWLVREGYDLGDAFLNFPQQPLTWRRPARADYTEFDESRLHEGDLLLEATRFPLNDPVRIRKRVPRGFTRLEGKLDRFWSQFFDYVDRGNVALTADVEKSLLEGCEAYASMELQLNGGADVKFVDGAGYRGAPPLKGSVAFFLRTEQAWPGGPGLFSAFGMDARATAVWSWLLCNAMGDLPTRRGFFMVALERPEEQEARGWFSDIASGWKAQLVLEHEFDENY